MWSHRKEGRAYELFRCAYLGEVHADHCIVMVKPAMPYLDVIHEAAQRFDHPICAYHVSGEYSMLRMAVDQGIMGEEVILESLLAIKRAGAKLIITYFALDIARKLKEDAR